MSQDNVPKVYATLVKEGKGSRMEYVWKVVCPYCDEIHTHGADINDLEGSLGDRGSHCGDDALAKTGRNRGSYNLIRKGGANV